MLRNQASAQGFSGNPDVFAHSFGTWLFGHILRDELKRPLEDRLHFGRVVLLGCILRPDFDWKTLQYAGLVEDVLNHYGTADPVVPLAHPIIFDSGPSGRRGFDGAQVLNLRAEGSGHSDLLLASLVGQDGLTNLERSYSKFWKPFLTLPREDLLNLPDLVNPQGRWRELPFLLRGTIFPFFALPLAIATTLFSLINLGEHLMRLNESLLAVALACATGLLLLLICTAAVNLWRSAHYSKPKQDV